MRDETGCYIWIGLFVLGFGAYIVEEYWTEIIWFLSWAVPILIAIFCLLFLLDYIHTIFLANFNSKIKKAMQFNVDIERIENEIDIIKDLNLKYYRGANYYPLIERSDIFKP